MEDIVTWLEVTDGLLVEVTHAGGDRDALTNVRDALTLQKSTGWDIIHRCGHTTSLEKEIVTKGVMRLQPLIDQIDVVLVAITEAEKAKKLRWQVPLWICCALLTGVGLISIFFGEPTDGGFPIVLAIISLIISFL